MDRRLRILFLCTGNSCRSQMAEAWSGRLKGGEIEAFSAGTDPHGLDPYAVKVMAESGVDISGAASKSVMDYIGEEFDYVVTVCDNARETCPIFPGAGKVVHAGFDDPPSLAAEAASDEEKLAIYRRVRDEIMKFVEGLPGDLEALEAGDV